MHTDTAPPPSRGPLPAPSTRPALQDWPLTATDLPLDGHPEPPREGAPGGARPQGEAGPPEDRARVLSPGQQRCGLGTEGARVSLAALRAGGTPAPSSKAAGVTRSTEHLIQRNTSTQVAHWVLSGPLTDTCSPSQPRDPEPTLLQSLPDKGSGDGKTASVQHAG